MICTEARHKLLLCRAPFPIVLHAHCTLRDSRDHFEMREANEILISSHSRHVYNFGSKPYPSEQSPLTVTRAFGAQAPPKLVYLEQGGCTDVPLVHSVW